jgi:hypothetical protein
MKSVFNPYRKVFAYLFVCASFYSHSIEAQQPITSVVTNNVTYPQNSYTGIKGAGLRNPLPLPTLISSWDSLLTSYTVNFNAPAAANVLRLSQFSVGSFGSNLLTMPVDALVKIRRSANPDVGDARNYFNFWAAYSSTPLPGALGGTFNFTAPEVTDPEQAFLLNNMTSGYDNIFQNTIANPHFGNIERIDFIIPSGLNTHSATDIQQSGIAVIDRGTGDPFKVAVITALDASGNPSAFGSLISVTAANFGGNLLPAAFNYGILINDSKFKSESRPSTRSNQNLRGVYISLADMGITIGQRFYGYALFGPDVVTPAIDWTTYPNNTSGLSQLDPVNVMGLYKTPGAVLPLPVSFSATRSSESARLDIRLYNEFKGEQLIVQQSTDGINFRDISKIYTHDPGTYTYTDLAPSPGINYYRLKMTESNGHQNYSETRLVKFDEKTAITIFPNPASSQLNIQFPSSWMQEKVTAEIFSTAGQLIKRIHIEHAAMQQSIAVNTLQPGAYVLKLVKNGEYGGVRQSFTIL